MRRIDCEWLLREVGEQEPEHESLADRELWRAQRIVEEAERIRESIERWRRVGRSDKGA